MPVVEIGQSSYTVEAFDADTTYHVASNINNLVSGMAINGSGSAANRIFDIEGHIAGTSYAINLGNSVATGNTVLVGTTGMLESSAGTSVLVTGSASKVVNDGGIVGSVGVAMIGDDNRVINRSVVAGDNTGVLMNGDDSKLTNSGTITGTAAVKFTTDANENAHLLNTGKVYGDIWAVTGSAGREIIDNRGILGGIVQLEGGNDVFRCRGNGYVSDEVRGGLGDDRYVVNRNTYHLVEKSGEGNDTIVSTTNYTLGDYFEHLTLAGKGNISGTGNGTSNHLIGNGGNNVLKGMAGLDELSGKAGKDILWGGDAADTFIFNPNSDREIVADFTDGMDRVRFMAGKDVTSSIDLLANHATEVNGNVVLEANGTTFVIKNIDLDHFTISDFIF